MPSMQGVSDVHLVDEGWQVFFVRQFLLLDHPFRRDIKYFTKDVVVEGPAPQMMIGAVVCA